MYSLTTTLSSGDILDFAIDADGAGVLDVEDPATLDQIADGSDNTNFTVKIALLGEGPEGNQFIRGNANGDGVINITDGIYILNFLFLGGETPECLDAADSNNDDIVNITDGIYVLNFLFLGGGDPPAPFPACGLDPEGDEDGVTCLTQHADC
jgi:hypothetical protein